MPTRNVNLTDQYDAFVHDQISSGEFKNASEVVRAGLKLLKNQVMEEKQKIKLLQSLAKEGFRSIDQGTGINADSEFELRKQIAAIGKRAVQKPKSDSQ